MASIWRKTWENLKISFNDFIRTTEERHKKAVEKFYLKAKQN
jgi:methionyl-tRNA synthetase